ncbi:PREDICTED: uncharacterized protein LOC104611299 isoform X2 [Nelumbo nucifera]|uniref:Uncharacterized protein LOC104611299 isoform X2 n=1 Tax=Nelumbo nucifera TaxID=4432 RepID=A0A1U8BHW6_NELNU|nr:PREDICTED: uncharacterized protein LOC104611299 isoform X2 [Nelumbo nucifera]
MAEESETRVSNPPPSSLPKSSEENLKQSQSQVPAFPFFPAFPNGELQMYPIMYPALAPGLIPVQNQEHSNRGAGIYAVPVLPFMGPMSGIPTNTLIPLTYSLPTYQTGALTPLIRWLSQGMQRPVAPPQPRPGVRAENGPAPARPEDENAAPGEAQPGVGDDLQHEDDANQQVENENRPEPGAGNGVNWLGIAKEIQMIVVGFITSLLPGFHNVD